MTVVKMKAIYIAGITLVGIANINGAEGRAADLTRSYSNVSHGGSLGTTEAIPQSALNGSSVAKPVSNKYRKSLVKTLYDITADELCDILSETMSIQEFRKLCQDYMRIATKDDIQVLKDRVKHAMDSLYPSGFELQRFIDHYIIQKNIIQKNTSPDSNFIWRFFQDIFNNISSIACTRSVTQLLIFYQQSKETLDSLSTKLTELQEPNNKPKDKQVNIDTEINRIKSQIEVGKTNRDNNKNKLFNLIIDYCEPGHDQHVTSNSQAKNTTKFDLYFNNIIDKDEQKAKKAIKGLMSLCFIKCHIIALLNSKVTINDCFPYILRYNLLHRKIDEAFPLTRLGVYSQPVRGTDRGFSSSSSDQRRPVSANIRSR